LHYTIIGLAHRAGVHLQSGVFLALQAEEREVEKDYENRIFT
jgi:hypothetical protein